MTVKPSGPMSVTVLTPHTLDSMPTEKACSKCGEVKPLSNFYPQRLGKFGRRANCKACHIRLAADWRRENAESARTQKRKYQSDPAVRARRNAQSKARRDAFRAANPLPKRDPNAPRTCTKCGETKAAEAYYKQRGKVCKKCHGAQGYVRHKERLASEPSYRERCRGYWRKYDQRKRAERKAQEAG